MIRVVIDTNLLVSALLFGGVPARVYDLRSTGQIIILTSDMHTAELTRVLYRAKFSKRFELQQQTPGNVISGYLLKTETVIPVSDIPADAIRDPRDLPVLACAVGGQADYIVSGDQDLLVLGAFRGIPIMSAAQFLERLAAPSPPDVHPTPPPAI